MKALGAVLCALCLLAPSAGVRAQSSTAPLIAAFAQHGVVYTLRADGSTHPLTGGTNAVTVDLSPNTRQIAYITANRRGQPFLNGVWRVPVAAPRQFLIVGMHGIRSGTLSWSPDSRLLAYTYDRDIAISSGVNPDFAVSMPRDIGAIAWGPGSTRVAVALSPLTLQTPPQTLTVALVNVQSRSRRLVQVRFPPRALGNPNSALGRHPDESELGWTADGRHLLISTILNGAGHALAGVWSVPATGGVARLVVSIPTGPAPSRASLRNATSALASRNGQQLAISIGNQFWVAGTDGKHGRVFSTPTAIGCAVTQYGWLNGNGGLAYVTNCPVAGTATILSRLYVLPFSTRTSRLVATGVGREAIRLAGTPTFRCIACG